MSNLELELDFIRMKNEILGKIQKTKEKWQRVWQEAQGILMIWRQVEREIVERR